MLYGRLSSNEGGLFSDFVSALMFNPFRVAFSPSSYVSSDCIDAIQIQPLRGRVVFDTTDNTNKFPLLALCEFILFALMMGFIFSPTLNEGGLFRFHLRVCECSTPSGLRFRLLPAFRRIACCAIQIRPLQGQVVF